MKKIIPVMAAFLLLTGCGSKGDTSSAAPAESAPDASVSSSAAMDSEAASSAIPEEELNTMSGTIDEIKDFMFVLTDENGNAVQFTYEGEEPEGLDEAEVGEQVIVTYTGEVSEVDPFTGTIISVEADELQ